MCVHNIRTRGEGGKFNYLGWSVRDDSCIEKRKANEFIKECIEGRRQNLLAQASAILDADKKDATFVLYDVHLICACVAG